MRQLFDLRVVGDSLVRQGEYTSAELIVGGLLFSVVFVILIRMALHSEQQAEDHRDFID